MRKLTALFGLLALSLGMSSCKKEEFLYISDPAKSLNHEEVFQVKALVKGSQSIDILWLIDNSGSMGTHQSNIASNMDIFMKQFTAKSDVYWKMGLISTDQKDTPYLGFDKTDLFDWNDKDPVQRFGNAVGQLGIGGDVEEKMATPIIRNLRMYPNFMRPATPLAIIMVTDTYDQSSQTDVKNLASFLTSFMPAEMIKVYGILAYDENKCSNESWYYKGSSTENLINTFGGQVYKLCDPNFGTLMAKLGDDLYKAISVTKIYLKARPIPSTLQVLYKSKPLAAGETEDGGYWMYDYESNAIVFNSLEFSKDAINDFVTVTYEEEHP